MTHPSLNTMLRLLSLALFGGMVSPVPSLTLRDEFWKRCQVSVCTEPALQGKRICYDYCKTGQCSMEDLCVSNFGSMLESASKRNKQWRSYS